ncbi:LysR substrate-binding domain-containing protein [Ancylobacter sp. MQZ15Z-1]|uniref:LysR substrate-binding domain-containing protein n=1 Tax=Ancylobacter mangrovi TaxID=2972472 RepID=A0A9X2PGS4_9HYPH|nr:LysR substrate-binding domain-containing protein [Ancylobacter mangrovi]MCS0495152.1 LysR substrate-binding domain-containing protein [Ancylobacter mangrovi]
MRYPDLEIDLVRAFVAVAEAGGFTAAAGAVGRSQSAVSQKILRLEDMLGRRLFERTSRSLYLTRDGEAFLVSARRIIELNDATVRGLLEPAPFGSLRLGVAEDFIPRQLPALLARFARLYPQVQLELRTGLSCELLEAYDAGALDVVIAKRDGRAQRGRVIWREPLVWMAASGFVADPEGPVPLVLLCPPCTYREVMVRALDGARRDWFAACTASSLMGVHAAVEGGLGVTVLGRSFVQEGMQVLEPSDDWPPLPMTEIVVIGDEGDGAGLVRPLLSFLTESLSASRNGAELAAPAPFARAVRPVAPGPVADGARRSGIV